VEESLPFENLQTLHFKKKIYSTDTLYLKPKQKNKIEIDFKEDVFLKKNKTIFVSIELLYYLNENHQKFSPIKTKQNKIEISTL